jgi:DNA mismatch repair ATPase MutS
MEYVYKIKQYLIDKDIIEKHNLINNINIDFKLPNIEFLSITDNILVGDDVYKDIEYDQVFKHINSCYLIGGSDVLDKLLKNPINDIQQLEKRKRIIQNIENLNSNNDFLQILKETEKDILSYDSSSYDDLFNMAYFKMFYLKDLNKNSYVLTMHNLYRIVLSPLLTILTPIVYIIFTYFILIYMFKTRIPFLMFLKFLFSMNPAMMMGGTQSIKYIYFLITILLYFQGLFNSLEISSTLHKVCKYIVDKMNNIVKYLKNAQLLINKLWTDDIISHFNLNPKIFIEHNTYIDSLKEIKYSFIGHDFGKQLKEYKLINKDIVNSILYKTYILDAIISIINFKNIKKYSYTSYLNDIKPCINVKEIRHPSLENPVDNSLIIKDKNMILTAGNSAGKSVLLKSLLINVITSQTVCISCSSNCTMTPFYHINSQINIPDSTGYESLYQAEMFRCKSNLDILKSLNKNQHSFIVMDEIFNSTNPYEGIAGAYSICKKLSQYDNNLLIFTTHYNYLTKLAKDTNRFQNYKMEAIVGDNIIFTYKLKKGINKHHLALELLKLNGFDEDIIDEAIKIKKQFLS